MQDWSLTNFKLCIKFWFNVIGRTFNYCELYDNVGISKHAPTIYQSHTDLLFPIMGIIHPHNTQKGCEYNVSYIPVL